MNERIRLLAEQACVHAITTKSMEDIADGCYVVSPAQLQQFAELIVRKCIKMVENEAAQYAEPVWAFELVNDMHEHFGVTE